MDRVNLTRFQLADLINETFTRNELLKVVNENETASKSIVTPLAEGNLTILLAASRPNLLVVITDLKGFKWKVRFIEISLVCKLSRTNFSARFGQMRIWKRSHETAPKKALITPFGLIIVRIMVGLALSD